METSEKTNNQTHEAGQSLFPTAVSEEKLDEARRKSTFSGFRKHLQATGENQLQRSDFQPGSIIVQSKAAEHYIKGKEAVEKSEFEKAVVCFSKAIVLRPELVQLHVSQGEAYIQLCDFESAAECYKRACFLEPGAYNARLAFIYNQLGQYLFDGGLFLEALQAFRNVAELKPDDRTYRTRSLACLTAAGRHADCLKELNGLITESPTAELYVFRARVHKVMNQTSCCVRDVKSALALDPTCREAEALLLQLKEASEEARQQAVLRMLSDKLQEALCLINTALESSPEDGRLYLFRGILYRRLKEFTSAIEDLVQAAELSELEEKKVRKVKEETNESCSVQEEVQLQLALTYNDFAVQCFSRGLYAEATLLLNKAIKEEKNLAGLYLNRGDCFFKQGDWCYALLDYQQAEEMMSSDEPAVRLRLAVIHNTLGSFCFQDGRFQDAVDMFSLAIKYNPTVSQYYENRSKALRRVQNLRGAREDFLCMLILDPNNEEAPPMMMNLFPGSTMSEVMSSTKERALRAELTKTIQAWNSSSDPQSQIFPFDLF
ncbi:tetratricopeptide repeat protein 16-like isoform X3 [Girardinichthys multiradiatus]|uniref:tetratricopeptide repeat protein 16-like isoform X3 n=1 Tax=Girardinichthys multiradiatus TaxID=208333 RepID=UPI001FAE01C0|nr:tetratricopeptide repeat protein 16-like isoform X3 [Girardinichthys multiradiatus]